MSKDLSWEIKRSLSTKEIIEMGIFKFFRHFSKIYKKGERYRADKIGERVNLCPTPTFMLKIGNEKLFYL